MSKEIIEKIDVYKEVLSTMPQNTEKNKERYFQKISDMLDEYTSYEENILKEIKKRYNEKTNIKQNDEIERLEKEIYNYEEILEDINEIKTSYEKSNLDKEVYKLGKYYKENLENVNNQIMKSVNIFRNIGIEITKNDFSYSQYAEEYMDTFFNEMKTGDVNSEIVKEKFEEIYWKCPELITHIEIIIKTLYLKNKKEIDKYYTNKKNNVLNKYKIDEEKILEDYKETRRKLDEILSDNKKIILQLFLDGKLNIKDYTDEKINRIYEQILSTDIFNKMQEETNLLEEINKNVVKFINSIYEYKNYIRFEFIYKAVKKMFEEIEQYKNKYKENMKKIEEYEKQLKKLTNQGLFGKKENQTSKCNEIILNMKNEYKELANNILYTRISQNISKDSTIYDAFKFADCFYNFLVKCIIEQNKEIEQNEIENFITDFNNYIKSPYFTIINNISISEEKDIALIIKDRYKLLNFNIEKQDLEEENLDNLLDSLEKINIRNNINKSGLTIEQIDNICEYNRILKNGQK